MKTLSDQFGQLILERLKALDTNAFSVEQKAGLPPDSIRNVLRSEKRAGPTLSRAQEICDALGLEITIGLPSAKGRAFSEDPGRSDFTSPPATLGHDYLSIPWHTPKPGAGSSPVSFSYAWMTAHALIPDRLTAISPDHVDTQDHFAGSTLAVIDARAPRRQTFGLWCYSEIGKVYLSRLMFDRGSILIMPRQPTQPPRLLLEAEANTIQLLGRVVWIGVVPSE